MASDPSLIFTNVDYNAQGKQVDWLYLPHSVTRSAYGALAIPIAVIRNGDGPTVFLMSGNHGDEYEGQITLAKLIRELEPEQVRGRIIILPAANLPAAMAGTRVSPIDQGNLNRAFPGDPQG
ncbi:MAG: succinylglutamate desuccinylase/aspartoacylase family protein, partial [Rhodoferax sp.]|nr:succinylglutamate desuccinylase/aspartoacylase family protein [Rhodoferax sp.]